MKSVQDSLHGIEDHITDDKCGERGTEVDVIVLADGFGGSGPGATGLGLAPVRTLQGLDVTLTEP